MQMGGAAAATMPRRLLHVGCGNEPLYPWLVQEGWVEVRLDIDPEVKPDIVASITDLGEIGTFERLVANHVVEHVYPAEVCVALAEFYRVLEPGGFAIIGVPDLEGVSPTHDILYHSAAGPVCGHDLFYGYHRYLHNPYYAHHTGFIAETLDLAMRVAGFDKVETVRMGDYQLCGVGVKV